MNPNLKNALQLIQKTRNLYINKKMSPTLTLITKLKTRIEQNNMNRTPNLIQKIKSKYIREPNVTNKLMRILIQFKIVNPQKNPQTKSISNISTNQPPPNNSKYI